MYDIRGGERWAASRPPFTGDMAEWIDKFVMTLSPSVPSDSAEELSNRAYAAWETQGEFDPFVIALIEMQLGPFKPASEDQFNAGSQSIGEGETPAPRPRVRRQP